MEADLVESGGLQSGDLLGVDGSRVQVDVVLRSEPALQQFDHVDGAVQDDQGVPSGNPRAGGVHGLGLGDDLIIGGPPALVGVDDVQSLLLQGNGAVEAAPSAFACNEQDHLGSVDAVLASLGHGAGAQ